MQLHDTLLLSTRTFKASKMRTFLTVLGMSVGIGAVLFLVSLGYGLQSTLLERITTSDSLLTLDVSEAKGGLVMLSEEALKNFKIIPEVREVSSGAHFPAQGIFNDTLIDITAVAIDASFFRLGGIRLDRGEPIIDQQPTQLVLSSALASVFADRIGKDVLGQEIRLTLFKPILDEETARIAEPLGEDRSYVIGGVIPLEEKMVFIHQNSLSDIQIDRFAQVKVRVKDDASLSGVRDTILEQGFLVSALSDTVDQAKKIFGILQLILMSFGIIALVVSAIGMFNTMTIALLERTEEIGVMKSIGASDLDISSVFILEATLMGFLGGLGGVLIGVLGGRGVNMLINFLAVRFGGESVNLFVSPIWFVVFIIVFAAFVGLMTGFVPARRASKIDPLDAIRYK